MLNKVLNVEVSDTTDDDSSNAVKQYHNISLSQYPYWLFITL